MEPQAAPERRLVSCQWCGAPFEPGAERCAACGATVPRPDGLALLSLLEPTLGDVDGSDAPRPTQPSSAYDGARDDDLLAKSLLTVALTALVGGALGWLFLPTALARAFQAALALPTEPSDVTRLGAFLGVLAGLFSGTLYRLVQRR